MTTAQVNEFVKVSAAKALNINEIATQIDKFTWAIPVEVEGETRYAKVSIVAAQAKATKTTEAFDLKTAVSNFEAAQEEAAERAAEKAAEKAKKAAAKNK